MKKEHINNVILFKMIVMVVAVLLCIWLVFTAVKFFIVSAPSFQFAITSIVLAGFSLAWLHSRITQLNNRIERMEYKNADLVVRVASMEECIIAMESDNVTKLDIKKS